MDALAQRWFMVGWLADGWRWFTTVGPTLPRRATLHWANADCQRWPNVGTRAGPTLGQRIHAIWVIGVSFTLTSVNGTRTELTFLFTVSEYDIP